MFKDSLSDGVLVTAYRKGNISFKSETANLPGGEVYYYIIATIHKKFGVKPEIIHIILCTNIQKNRITNKRQKIPLLANV